MPNRNDFLFLLEVYNKIRQLINNVTSSVRKNITVVSVVSALSMVLFFTFPAPTLSDSDYSKNPLAIIGPIHTIFSEAPNTTTSNALPTIDKAEPRVIKTYHARMTYYESKVAQTDGNPWITASGARVHWGTVAANCLPIGTKIRIPDIYGDQTFTVLDRHSRRFGCGLVDVWTDHAPGHDAKTISSVRIEVLENAWWLQ
ncbi:MAG TPA: hypothetical protein VJB65_01240 [Patescibacteria group bacterium]|nr:hypothetical protein [Patescibacteria group bacterium]